MQMVCHLLRFWYRAVKSPCLGNFVDTGTMILYDCSSSHYSYVIMSTMASQITGILIVCSTVCSNPDQRKHQSSALLAFVSGNHRWLVTSLHKGPVTRKMFHLMTSPCSETLDLYSYRLIGTDIPIINLRRSSDRLRFIMEIPIPVRWRLFSEYGPRRLWINA